MFQRIRIVVGKIGLDGHDRGAKVISAAFREAGFEVIYTGIRQTPEQLVSIAIQEDADIIAISILSGAHNKLCKKVIDLLKERKAEDIQCIVGGIIPQKDAEYLNNIGILSVFGPGTDTNDIVAYIKEAMEKQKKHYTL